MPAYNPISAPLSRKQADHFWSRVAIHLGECWEWLGALTNKHYGHFSIRKPKQIWLYAHRTAYELTVGKVPDGLFVLHKCDNRSCCNPDHLFLGTNLDNVHDMLAKGRHRYGIALPEKRARGERSATAKLTNEKVKAIRERYAQGEITMRSLGSQFGVNATTVYMVVQRRTWIEI